MMSLNNSSRQRIMKLHLVIVVCLTFRPTCAESGSSKVLLQLFTESGIGSSPCVTDLIRMAKSLNESWVIQMLDSIGKPESGLTTKNLNWPGSEYECKRAEVPATSGILPTRSFKGNHCLIKLEPKLTIEFLNQFPTLFLGINISKLPEINKIIGKGFSLATCFPDTCKNQDISKIIQFGLSLLGSQISVDVRNYLRVHSVECSSDPEHQQLKEIATIVLLVLLIAPTIYVTFKELLCGGLGPNDSAFLKSFSAFKNTKTILSAGGTREEFPFINGIRLISQFWVILHHEHIFTLQLQRNSINHVNSLLTPRTVIVVENIVLDNFMFISSFLVVHHLLKRRGPALNTREFFLILLNRYVRLGLPMLICGAATVNLGNYLGSGRVWNLSEGLKYHCTNTWWTFPLLINNFNTDVSCLNSYWYIAVDFQLLSIALLILAVLLRSRRLGITLAYSMLLVSIGIYTYIVYAFEMVTQTDSLKSIAAGNIPTGNQGVKKVLLRTPFTRIPYWIGFSYALYLNKASPVPKGTGKYQPWVWVIQTMMSVGIVVFGLYFPFYVDRNRLGNNFYLPVIVVLKGLGLVLLFQVCIHYRTSLPCRFLSWRLWNLLSRLGIGVYLLHVFVIDWATYSGQQLPVVSQPKQFSLWCGIIVTTTAGAFLLSLLVERPLANLMSLAFRKTKEKSGSEMQIRINKKIKK